MNDGLGRWKRKRHKRGVKGRIHGDGQRCDEEDGDGADEVGRGGGLARKRREKGGAIVFEAETEPIHLFSVEGKRTAMLDGLWIFLLLLLLFGRI